LAGGREAEQENSASSDHHDFISSRQHEPRRFFEDVQEEQAAPFATLTRCSGAHVFAYLVDQVFPKFRNQCQEIDDLVQFREQQRRRAAMGS